ncbi:MAG: hypothetical protein Q9172_004062 [Xanthocarpia lactea]
MNSRWAIIWVACICSAGAWALPAREQDAIDYASQNQLDVACMGPAAPRTTYCYNALNISQYLVTWPLSNPACLPGELWSTCYIRIATNQSGVDCTTVDSTSCNFNRDLDPSLEPSVIPQIRYVLASIQNIYSVFSKLANGESLYVDFTWILVANEPVVTKEINRSDPVLLRWRSNPLNLTNNGTVDPGNYNTALTLGLPFLAYRYDSFVGKTIVSKDLLSLASDFVDRALPMAPSLIGDMWASDGSTAIDTDDVFSSGLETLMSRVRRFVTFASYGTFSLNDSIADSLNATAGLTLAASTLVTTTALLQNGFVAVPDATLVRDPKLLVPHGRNSSECTLLNHNGSPPDHICNPLTGSAASSARYWSSTSGRVYNFLVNETSNAGKATLASGKTHAKQALLDIYNGGYADMNVMFDGGYECTSRGDFGKLFLVSSNGRMNFDCFTSLPVRTKVSGASRPPLLLI